MSITRFWPPFYPGEDMGRHMPMSPNAHGKFVTYSSHMSKIKDKEYEIRELKRGLLSKDKEIEALKKALEEATK